MVYSSAHKMKLIQTLLFLLLSSSFFVLPALMPSSLAVAQNTEFIAVSQPAVARFGLDGPPPIENLYSALDAIGTYNLIVILVEFTDETHYFSSTQVETNALTALNDYYNEVSYGLVTVAGDATPWLDLGNDRSHYVDGTTFPSDPKFNLVQDAIALADPIVDFSAYDGVTIIHAGQGQELSHNWRDYWSSEWFNFTISTGEGAIHRASVSPEESTVGQPSYVGVLAHEFGHDLGLPDLYDVTYSGIEYVGHWGLMAKGSWNGPIGVGDQPSHMMGYCKAELGWVNGSQLVESPVELSVQVDPLETSTVGVHLVKIPLSADEYFLVEVRRKIGYDASLPDEGVLLTHIDESKASGHGIVQVIDSHPITPTKDDGAFDIGLGEVDSYTSSYGQFSLVVESIVDQSYNIEILRAFMEFITPPDGSAILTPNVTVEWTGSAAGHGIDHFELFIDGSLSYLGNDTSHPITGLTAGVHNATLVMELSDTGRRLSIQSLFIVDLAPPVVQSVIQLPTVPGVGDAIYILTDVTDDTWIVNATVFVMIQGSSGWTAVSMTNYSVSEWRAFIGTYGFGVTIEYYVAVTDAGGRTVTDDNAGANYSFTVSGIGTIIPLIIGAAVLLLILIVVCMRLQRRRREPEVSTYFEESEPKDFEPTPSDYTTPAPPATIRSTCQNCGAPLAPNAIYCGHCGYPVS